MRGLIWLIVLFALAVGVAQLAGINDGYALLVLPPYRAQVSLNFLALALGGMLIAGYFLLRLISNTLRLPRQVVAYRDRRRKDKVAGALREATRFQLEGRYAQALKQAKKAWGAGDDSGVSALLAARAAHAMLDEKRYREWISRALEHDDSLRAARLMTEAEMAVDGRRFDEAAERISEAKRNDNRPIASLRLALKVSHAQENWEEVVRIVRQLRKHRALTDSLAEPMVRRAHLAALRERDGKGAAMAEYWRVIPANEQGDRQLIEKAVPLLVANGQGAVVRRVLEKTLDAQWDSALARLYGDCGSDDPLACLSRGEQWLKAHPDDRALMYALGRLCLQTELWGKAQGYLEASVTVTPTVDAHLALAQLAEKLDKPQDAQAHFRRAAQLTGASKAVPALPPEEAEAV